MLTPRAWIVVMGNGCLAPRITLVDSGRGHNVQAIDGQLLVSLKRRGRREASLDYGNLLFLGQDLPYQDIARGEEIGKGNFGVVYKGYAHGKKLAVKELFYDPTHPDNTVQEFHREIQVLSLLQHDNIVRFLGAVQQPPHFCIIMEYCETSVSAFLELAATRRIKVTFGFLAKIISGTAQAINYLHNGIVPQVLHRDIKAENLLLTQDFTVKVTDFGLSRAVEESSSHMTMCGSILWVAPEIMRGEQYDSAVDVYSFGITLWEIANFQKPWPGHEPSTVPYLVTVKILRPTDSPHVPEYLTNLMRHCWADDPASRPGFMEITRYLEDASSCVDFKQHVLVDSSYHGTPLPDSLRRIPCRGEDQGASFSASSFSFDKAYQFHSPTNSTVFPAALEESSEMSPASSFTVQQPVKYSNKEDIIHDVGIGTRPPELCAPDVPSR